MKMEELDKDRFKQHEVDPPQKRRKDPGIFILKTPSHFLIFFTSPPSLSLSDECCIQGGITLKASLHSIVCMEYKGGGYCRGAYGGRPSGGVLNQEQVPGSDGDIMLSALPLRGKMTRQTRDFIENLDTGKWSGRTIVAFWIQ